MHSVFRINKSAPRLSASSISWGIMSALPSINVAMFEHAARFSSASTRHGPASGGGRKRAGRRTRLSTATPHVAEIIHASHVTHTPRRHGYVHASNSNQLTSGKRAALSPPPCLQRRKRSPYRGNLQSGRCCRRLNSMWRLLNSNIYAS